ncbi:MAG: 2-C-methyl-D-erythritol 2,4-cyclodiphosphate synthase [Candidatus Krumholzibacteriia bacterium]
MSPEERPRFRAGQGYDVHAFGADRPLLLGGVEVACERGGLVGHSDADVLTHAIASALLGSLACGDLGTHFPDTDERYRNASSLELLRHVVAMLRERGYAPVNCDATLIAQQPRLSPHIPDMCRKLAEVLELPRDCVSVKSTTAEGLGAVGRAEGIAAQAIVLVERT